MSLSAATAARIARDARTTLFLQEWCGHTVERCGVRVSRARLLRLELRSLVGEVTMEMEVSQHVTLMMLSQVLDGTEDGRVLAEAIANQLLRTLLEGRPLAQVDLSVVRLDNVEPSLRERDHPTLRIGGIELSVTDMQPEFGLFVSEELQSYRDVAWFARKRSFAVHARIVLIRRVLTREALRALKVGDVFVAGPAPLFVDCLVGHRRGCRAEVRIDDLHGLVAMRSSFQVYFEDENMSDAAPVARDDLLDGLELPIRFEISSTSLDLATLSALEPGQVLALDVPLAQATVQLCCQGRLLGRGQLLALGDLLGVRLTALYWGAGDAARN